MNKSYKKSPREIEIMIDCGARLRAVTDELLTQIHPGLTTLQVDNIARDLLERNGLGISFQTVSGYKYATCLPVNSQAVHTEPDERELTPGDLLTIDIGGLYKGYHTDWATTICVGQSSPSTEISNFMNAGKQALARSIEAFRPGVYLGELGEIMQTTIESAGYKVLKDLTGHGIGKNLHEDPYIFNFRSKNPKKTYMIEEGFVCALEIIYSQSSEEIIQPYKSKWTIDTKDGSLAACFEHTVLATKNGVQILT